MTTRKIAYVIIAIVVAVLVISILSGCGNTKQDSGAGEINTGSANVIAFPNGFRNVAHKCDGHGHRVFSTSRGNSSESISGSVAVIADEKCGGGVP